MELKSEIVILQKIRDLLQETKKHNKCTGVRKKSSHIAAPLLTPQQIEKKRNHKSWLCPLFFSILISMTGSSKLKLLCLNKDWKKKYRQIFWLRAYTTLRKISLPASQKMVLLDPDFPEDIFFNQWQRNAKLAFLAIPYENDGIPILFTASQPTISDLQSHEYTFKAEVCEDYLNLYVAPTKKEFWHLYFRYFSNKGSKKNQVPEYDSDQEYLKDVFDLIALCSEPRERIPLLPTQPNKRKSPASSSHSSPTKKSRSPDRTHVSSSSSLVLSTPQYEPSFLARLRDAPVPPWKLDQTGMQDFMESHGLD